MIRLTGAFLGLCFATFVVFWIVTAFSTKRTVQRSPRWRLGLLVAFVAIMFMRMVPGTFLRTWNVLWPQTLFVCLLGDALALAGLIVMLWARTILGRNWSAGVVLKEEHELIVRGPYRFVRHPIYSGGLLMLLGWAVWTGRITTFLVFGLTLLLFWFKARAEEDLLTQHFGDGYRDYKARVKALVPYVL